MQNGEILEWKCKKCGATLGLMRKTGRGYHQLLLYRSAINIEHEGEPPEVIAVLVGLVLGCALFNFYLRACATLEPDRSALEASMERLDAQKCEDIKEGGMNTGMMWFDNDPKTTLDVKIQRAADYYRQKYGCTPDLCLVNPGVLDKSHPEPESRQAGKILVQPFRSILPGHLWIGVDEKCQK